MEIFEYGDKNASVVLIHPVYDHDLAGMENEIKHIHQAVDIDFRLIALKVDSWNRDLSPWNTPAVFGDEDFGNGASATLAEILKLTKDRSKTYYIGGYSIAGLFALWAAYRTNTFRGVGAASPSVWFPGFTDYMKDNDIICDTVYLSLGNKESKTRNTVMATVSDKIREAHSILTDRGVDCTLEWNEGNHFKNADIRTAKAFAWVMNRAL